MVLQQRPHGSPGDAKHRPETRGGAALLTMRVYTLIPRSIANGSRECAPMTGSEMCLEGASVDRLSCTGGRIGAEGNGKSANENAGRLREKPKCGVDPTGYRWSRYASGGRSTRAGDSTRRDSRSTHKAHRGDWAG